MRRDKDGRIDCKWIFAQRRLRSRIIFERKGNLADSQQNNKQNLVHKYNSMPYDLIMTTDSRSQKDVDAIGARKWPGRQAQHGELESSVNRPAHPLASVAEIDYLTYLGPGCRQIKKAFNESENQEGVKAYGRHRPAARHLDNIQITSGVYLELGLVF
ncbi:hypothetical protein C8R44DRAFT_754969 [Mycena epipterygia]|nr:hypothetical protein C8R44DRAFT_754969 [Mycena epipterygia]